MMRVTCKLIGVSVLTLILCSCSFLSREQSAQMQDIATRMEMRVELNERAEQLVEESGGHSAETSKRLLKQLQDNSELGRLSAKSLRELIGGGEGDSD